MITHFRTYVDGLDGPVVIGLALLALSLLWLLCAVVNQTLRHAARPRAPRAESLSQRHHRLDTEARRATTRPSTSSRKAGRVPAAGGTR